MHVLFKYAWDKDDNGYGIMKVNEQQPKHYAATCLQ